MFVTVADQLKQAGGPELIERQVADFIQKCSAEHWWINVEFSVMWSWHAKTLCITACGRFQLHIF